MPAVLTVDHETPTRSDVARIAATLKRGGIVATRTDTICGLLASVNRPDALRRLADLKVRPEDKPFVLMAADWITVRSVTSHLTPSARVLGARYWPGPLTLVLPAAATLPDEVVAAGPAGPAVAVRIPGDRLLLEVLGDLRAAIAAPSANEPGRPPAETTAEVLEIFGDRIDLVLEDCRPASGAASTIVDCCHPVAEILRGGPITPTTAELSSH